MTLSDFVTNLLASDVRTAIYRALSFLAYEVVDIHERIADARDELSHEPTEVHYIGGSGYKYIEDGPSEFEKFEVEALKGLAPIRAAEQRINQISEMLSHHRGDTRIMLERSDYELIYGKGQSWKSV